MIVPQIKKLVLGSFFKNVAVLMSGTAIAQALAFAVAPILSRLYTPEAFGVFGLFIAVCGILTVVASGKYELAILLPKKDEDAVNILLLSIGVVVLISIISLIIIGIFSYDIAYILDSPELAPLLWMVPITVFFTGLYNTFNYWTTRRKQFKRLSISRVVQSIGKEGTQLIAGIVSNLQGAGLILGQIIGQVGSAVTLIAQTYRQDYFLIKKSFSKVRIKELAIKHSDFPKYNAPQDFLNSVSKNIPAILLAFYFNPAIVGFFWFTHRILLAPNHLIGNSVRQVFYQRANELVNEGSSVLTIYLKATKSLAILGLIPLILVLVAGPSLFSFIFGHEWLEAGRYAQWLILWWFFLFINPPSVMMIPILNKQKFHLYIGIFSLVLRTSAIIIGGVLSSSLLAIALYSISGVLINSIIIAYIYIKAKE